MMWLIGSRALKENGLANRSPQDWDFMGLPEDVTQLANILSNLPGFKLTESKKYPGKWKITAQRLSIEIDATENESRKFLTEIPDVELPYKVSWFFGVPCKIPDTKTLWVFKRSHANYPTNTEKTITDLIHLQKHLFGNAMLPGRRIDALTGDYGWLYWKLRGEAADRNGGRQDRINFNVPTEQFFKPTVGRLYQHDELHDLTYRYDAPLYRQHLKYPDKALIDMESFYYMRLEKQLTMVQEEAIVIGLERFWFVDEPRIDKDDVYYQGLLKLIKDLSKGKFQDFILDHVHLLEKPLWNFWKTLEERVAHTHQNA